MVNNIDVHTLIHTHTILNYHIKLHNMYIQEASNIYICKHKQHQLKL